MKIFKIVLKGLLSLFVLLGFSISKMPSGDFGSPIKSRLHNFDKRGFQKNRGLILKLGMAACNTPSGPNHGSHSSHASHSSHRSSIL